MIVIKLELHPGSDLVGDRTRELGRLAVANDETSEDPAIGNYNVYLADVTLQDLKRVARVEDFPRLERSAWELAECAIKAALARRSGL